MKCSIFVDGVDPSVGSHSEICALPIVLAGFSKKESRLLVGNGGSAFL